MTLREKLHQLILEIPKIEYKESRFSKVEAYHIGRREIAHFHNGNEIDIRLTRKEIKSRGWHKNETPRIHIRNANSDWIEMTFRRSTDLDLILQTMKKAKECNS